VTAITLTGFDAALPAISLYWLNRASPRKKRLYEHQPYLDVSLAQF